MDIPLFVLLHPFGIPRGSRATMKLWLGWTGDFRRRGPEVFFEEMMRKGVSKRRTTRLYLSEAGFWTAGWFSNRLTTDCRRVGSKFPCIRSTPTEMQSTSENLSVLRARECIRRFGRKTDSAFHKVFVVTPVS